MLKVLVVEDEALLRDSFIQTTPWENWDCCVAGSAENGASGLKTALQIQPDIIFVDIRMPVMDGIEMIRQLKPKLDAEYIILSGYDEFSYAKKGMELGVQAYLLKPVDEKELFETMDRVSGVVLRKNKEDNSNAAMFSEFVREMLGLDPNKLGQNGYRVLSYMFRHYREELTISHAAGALLISGSYLRRILKKQTSMTFLDVLTRIRMYRATKLFKAEEPYRMYEIAEMVGYHDARYFSDTFRKTFGVLPSEYKMNKTGEE